MHEARAFAEGTPCQVNKLYFASRLAWSAVAVRIRENDLLAEHAHGYPGGALLNDCLLSRLMPRRHWHGRWRLIGGDSRDGCLRDRGRRRTGGLVLGRIDEDDEQKPDSQPDANHPLASGHIGKTFVLSLERLRRGRCSWGFLGPCWRRLWRRPGDFWRRFASRTTVFFDIGDECRKAGEACGVSLLFVVISSHG